jgi:hypothetical protein
MNFTESFQEFSSRLSTMDLALYAGVGIVLWVLFKDKLSPVQEFLTNLINKVKTKTENKSPSFPVVSVDSVTPVSVFRPDVVVDAKKEKEDVFFQLVASWKQTRDLAVKSNCSEAVKVADQMFPYLSPNVCKKEDTVV